MVEDNQETNIPYAQIIAIIILFILPAIMFNHFRKSKNKNTPKSQIQKGNMLYLMGECGSGKTSLLYLLKNSQLQSTVSSLEETVSKIQIKVNETKSKDVGIVDIPGHNYTKFKYLKEFKKSNGIIILVDSSNQKSFSNLAEYFYKILIQKEYQKKQIRTLIALNKQDNPLALKTIDFKHLFVNEIEKIKKSKIAIQEDEDDQIDDYLKLENHEFNFDQYQNIEIVEVSVHLKQIDSINQYIDKIFL